MVGHRLEVVGPPTGTIAAMGSTARAPSGDEKVWHARREELRANRAPVAPVSASVNHVGVHVTDLDRSQRFYQGVFGFEERDRLAVPDGATARLLRVEPPVGLTAVYLALGGFTLELLHFDRSGNPPARDRPFTEPGLTHLSISVDDLDAACTRVAELGGEVLADTRLGDLAVMVRDPDGQVVELLPHEGR